MLYKTMVRSHLQYAQNVWSPHKQKNIDTIEKVQRKSLWRAPGSHAK